MAISELDLPIGVIAHSSADPKRQAEVMADSVAGALAYAVQTHGVASLVVSGGRSPITFFEELSTRELNWSKVQVSLADERWVPVGEPASNEGLVRRHLLQNAAGDALLIGLYQPADSLVQAASLADQALARLRWPIDVLILGMGDDGHTASLFPGSPNLAHALRSDCAERCLPMQAPVAPHARLTMSYPLLASARMQCLAIQGADKLETLRAALIADPLQMPIRAFLHSPLEIYWCP
ncbi:6-phosphogluconolactonase [Pseudomonas stutzeri]|uniref:6-phosphogluconolactonase n=1 Tax=Stutzerimonas stutzeri TaxID=316 RepID=A0A2N8S7Z3_STUST|nr:6-phosphogluconolactonase [Stutzerimonas stutzeri]MCQ4295055.1 6-phosphogluconolactonase [Stutzerimonas stutzeri]PNF82729.1 6-phosphogluconolactonase [Stutzerimonas stutzeri]